VSKFADIVLICGHYEGFDERLNEYVNDSYSIGDYILTGGELPAMVITESITRLIEGVIDKESLDVESFDNNLLDFPVYTRPEVFDGKCVPNILLSGDQKKIKE
jgi:tRNA (guanine37-N1)-methyltransferase